MSDNFVTRGPWLSETVSPLNEASLIARRAEKHQNRVVKRKKMFAATFDQPAVEIIKGKKKTFVRF